MGRKLRDTLQETLEDDASHRGSSTRLVLVLTALTLCACLFILVTVHVQGKDMHHPIQVLTWALVSGGAAPYPLRRFADALKKERK